MSQRRELGSIIWNGEQFVLPQWEGAVNPYTTFSVKALNWLRDRYRERGGNRLLLEQDLGSTHSGYSRFLSEQVFRGLDRFYQQYQTLPSDMLLFQALSTPELTALRVQSGQRAQQQQTQQREQRRRERLASLPPGVRSAVAGWRRGNPESTRSQFLDWARTQKGWGRYDRLALLDALDLTRNMVAQPAASGWQKVTGTVAKIGGGFGSVLPGTASLLLDLGGLQYRLLGADPVADLYARGAQKTGDLRDFMKAGGHAGKQLDELNESPALAAVSSAGSDAAELAGQYYLGGKGAKVLEAAGDSLVASSPYLQRIGDAVEARYGTEAARQTWAATNRATLGNIGYHLGAGVKPTWQSVLLNGGQNAAFGFAGDRWLGEGAAVAPWEPRVAPREGASAPPGGGTAPRRNPSPPQPATGQSRPSSPRETAAAPASRPTATRPPASLRPEAEVSASEPGAYIVYSRVPLLPLPSKPARLARDYTAARLEEARATAHAPVPPQYSILLRRPPAWEVTSPEYATRFPSLRAQLQLLIDPSSPAPPALSLVPVREAPLVRTEPATSAIVPVPTPTALTASPDPRPAVDRAPRPPARTPEARPGEGRGTKEKERKKGR